jgi:hypothetical protein
VPAAWGGDCGDALRRVLADASVRLAMDGGSSDDDEGDVVVYQHQAPCGTW